MRAIIDCVFFAYRDDPVEDSARLHEPRLHVGVTPIEGGAIGSLVGRF